MPDLFLAKSDLGFLIPIDRPSADYVGKLASGAGVVASVKLHNNPQFHRKLMALFQFAFDAWEPPADLEYRGEPVRKQFNRFRQDLTIMAGYFDTAIDLHGRVRLTARSLNFSSMDHDEREALFNAVVDVVLTRILRNFTRADLDNTINQLLGFTR